MALMNSLKANVVTRMCEHARDVNFKRCVCNNYIQTCTIDLKRKITCNCFVCRCGETCRHASINN